METNEPEVFTVRWKGRQMGPYTRETLQQKLRLGELSQFHEVHVGERWVLLRNFLGQPSPAAPPFALSLSPQEVAPPPPEAAGPSTPTAAEEEMKPLAIIWPRETAPAPAEDVVPAARVPVAGACPQCGAPAEVRARFCAECGAALVAATAPPPYATAGSVTMRYAGFWRRVVAAFLDGLLVNAVGAVLGGVFFLLLGLAFRPSDEAWLGVVIISTIFLQGVLVLATWLYFALMECSRRQATLGKLALGLAVADLRGERISFGRATGRHFGKAVSSLIFMVGFIMAGFTERKQALHDMMAGCVVIVKGR